MPEFLSLAQILQPVERVPEQATIADETSVVEDNRAAVYIDDEDYLREIRFFHAHLRERLDIAVETLLCEISREVLARELLLAPVEIAAIVSDALARYRQLDPLRVRVHPEDAAALSGCDVPVFSDEALDRGDAFVDLRGGSMDLSLQTRLDDVTLVVRS
ncbi:MAG: hypothetical protein GIW97_09055 [Candidatus Eremiobacteraeota bacterium]|nr:hypothetical protein [Candidatus Eremiobacteraeota bacterium]